MTRTWIMALVMALLVLAYFGGGLAAQDTVGGDANAVPAVAADSNDGGTERSAPVLVPASGKVVVGAMFDYETIAAEVLYRPNVDSSVGLRAVCLKSGVDDALGLMAVTKFGMGDIYQATLNHIFPGDVPLDKLPAKPYAELGAGWDFKNNGFLFLSGTGIELFPERNIRPQVWTEYLVTGGGAHKAEGLGEQFRAMIGFVIEF